MAKWRIDRNPNQKLGKTYLVNSELIINPDQGDEQIAVSMTISEMVDLQERLLRAIQSYFRGD